MKYTALPFVLLATATAGPLAAADDKIYGAVDFFTDPYADTLTVEGGKEWDGKYNVKLGGIFQSVDDGAETVTGGAITVATTLENGIKLKGRATVTGEGLHGSLYARRNGSISMEVYCDHEYIATHLAIRRGIDSTGCSLTAETPDDKPFWAALTGDYHSFSDDNRRTMVALATRYKLSDNFSIAHRSRLLDFERTVPEYFSPGEWHRHQVTLQYFGKFDRGSYKLEAGPGLDFINGNRSEFGLVNGTIYYDFKKLSVFARATHQFGSEYHYSLVSLGASIPF